MNKKFIRKLRIFKNDPFCIKEICFDWKIKRCLKKGVSLRTKSLKVYLNIVNSIGIPRDEREKELLKKVIKSYDETVSKLEENLRYARIYISDESETENEQNKL